MADWLWSMSLMIKYLVSLLVLLITVGCQVTESTDDIPLGGLSYACDGKTYTIFHIGNGWALLNDPDLTPRTTATGFMLENQQGEIERSFDKISGTDVMTVYGESGKKYDCVFTDNSG